MTNPFAQHQSALFADRDSIDEALNYAHEVLGALVGSDRAAAMTAVMVLVNTAAKNWPQPVQADPARALLADHLADMVRQMVQETVGDLDSKMDEWAQNSQAFDDACDNRVERWVENNLDLSQEIGDFLRNGVTISIDTI